MINYALGKQKETKESLDTFLSINIEGSYRTARVFAFLKQTDKTFEYLEKAYQEKLGMWEVKSDLFFKDLHSDPRFINLLKRMNLPVN